MMPRPVYAALAIAFVSIPALADTDATTYDECVLETMKGVSSDVAARAIIDSCRRMFPDEPQGMPAAAPQPGSAEQAAAPEPASAAAPAAASQTAASSEPAPAAPAPRSTGSVRTLTDEELDKLEYRGNFFGTTYRVKVFNGNAKYTVVYDGQEETWAWKLFSAKGAD